MLNANNANQELSESEERFRLLAESTQEGIVLSENFFIIDVNDQLLNMFGYQHRTELIGKKLDQLILPGYLDFVNKKIAEPNPVPYEVHCFKKDNSEIIVKSSGRLIPYHGRTIRISVLTDITQQKKYETGLKESETRYRKLFENNLAAVYRSEADGGLSDINQAFAEVFGYNSIEELKNTDVLELYCSKQERDQYIINLRAKGHLKNCQMRMRKKDGSEIWVLENAMLVKEESTNREFIEGTLIDITETKRIQQALQESEQNYKSLIDHIPDGLLIHDDKGETLYANSAGLVMMGFTSLEATREKNLFHYVLPDFHEKIREKRRDMDTGASSPLLEIKIRRPDGEIIEVEIRTNRINYLGKQAVEVVMRDISLQRQLEREQMRYQLEEESNRELKREIASHIRTRQRLNANQKYTRLLLDSSIDMISACNQKGNITEFNREAQNTFGYSSTEVLDKGLSVLYAEAAQYETVRKIVSEDGTFLGEVKHIKKNGEIFPAYISAAILKNERGENIGMMSISRDITRIKETEEQLKKSVHEKDILLKEIHHRVKNNMQVISSILKLQSAYVKDKRTIELLDECRNRIASMAFIHATLYMTKDFTSINLAAYINNIAVNLKQSYVIQNKKILLKLDVPEVFLHIDDAIPCGLIINELLSNAFKYGFLKMKKGTVGISVKVKKENIILAIWDNGAGFPEKIDYKNTESLGLQLVSSLTEQLRGRIKMDSKPGEGTRFILAFRRTL
jgi:PAS domain S-box-containing protein